MNLDSELLEILACPACKSALRADDPASELVCTDPTCGYAYPVRDDIPVLLVDEARKPAKADDTDGKAEGSGTDAAPDAAGASSPTGPTGLAGSTGASGTTAPADGASDEPNEPTAPSLTDQADQNNPNDQTDQQNPKAQPDKDGESRP